MKLTDGMWWWWGAVVSESDSLELGIKENSRANSGLWELGDL